MKIKEIIKNKWFWIFFSLAIFLVIIFPRFIEPTMDCNFRMDGYPQICSETGEIKVIEPQYVHITPACCSKTLQPVHEISEFLSEASSNLVLKILELFCGDLNCNFISNNIEFIFYLVSLTGIFVILFVLFLLVQFLWRKFK